MNAIASKIDALQEKIRRYGDGKYVEDGVVRKDDGEFARWDDIEEAFKEIRSLDFDQEAWKSMLYLVTALRTIEDVAKGEPNYTNTIRIENIASAALLKVASRLKGDWEPQ